MKLTDEEICTYYGEDPQSHGGAVSPPIFQTSLFTFKDFKSFTNAQEKERTDSVYTRGVNPTTKILEIKLAKLERGEACKCFGSGMGAISATLLTLLDSGSHVLFVNNIYGPTLQLMDQLKKFNIHYDCVDNDLETIKSMIKENTKLIYMESPGTMLMNVVDIKGVSTLANSKGILTAIDNTWSTPLFQKPLTLGVDLSLHSLTKYIGGHSDVVAGAVVGDSELVDRIFQYGHQLNGSVLSPHDAYLLIRGLRTLPIRMKQHQDNAMKVLKYLQQKNEVQAIHHPSTETGNQAKIIHQQMNGFSGVLSFELKQNRFESIVKFIDALSLFKIGVSWGGYESLVNSPSRPHNDEALSKQGLPMGLIRLSLGLEGPGVQIVDLERAFKAIDE